MPTSNFLLLLIAPLLTYLGSILMHKRWFSGSATDRYKIYQNHALGFVSYLMALMCYGYVATTVLAVSNGPSQAVDFGLTLLSIAVSIALLMKEYFYEEFPPNLEPPSLVLLVLFTIWLALLDGRLAIGDGTLILMAFSLLLLRTIQLSRKHLS